jgi:putative membrane protein
MIAAFDFRILASVDAILNGLSLILIIAGLVAVKRGRVELHKKLMLAAVVVSALFLISYVIYHCNTEPVRFQRQDWLRPVYLTLLTSHIILAVVQVPLILRTVQLGLADRRAQHRKWAKVTTPIWLYVSFTGVVIYYMLYWL